MTPEERQSNPFVFVVGCPRSGTTLLQRMLDNHPQLTVANDTHFITRAAKKELRKDPDPILTAQLVEQVTAYRRFHRMGLDGNDIDAAASGCRRYSEFVSKLYDRRGELRGKRLSGEKTPDFCRKIRILHGLFPKAKFIHITRDGRDTALSAMNWANENKGPGKWSLWPEDALACCAMWWQWQAGQGSEQGRSLGPDHYHEVRYEQLVAHSVATLTRLADFLGIPDSESMSTYYRGKTRKKPGLSAKSAWLPPTKGLRDWREELSSEDIAVFEGLAGITLDQLGYTLSGEPATEAAEARISRARHWWQDQRMARNV